MTRKEALRIVNKRLSHLKKRIENSDKDLSFDKAEASALEFLIKRDELLDLSQQQALQELSDLGQEMEAMKCCGGGCHED